MNIFVNIILNVHAILIFICSLERGDVVRVAAAWSEAELAGWAHGVCERTGKEVPSITDIRQLFNDFRAIMLMTVV